MARQLAVWGWNVVLVSIDDEPLRSAGHAIRTGTGRKAEVVQMDLSTSDAAEKLFGLCRELDVRMVVNNAGVFRFDTLERTDLAAVDRFVGLHVSTVFKLTKLFADDMARRGVRGYILNSSSLAAFMAFPGIALYESTKAAVRQFSRAAWFEYRERGVTVTALCPGAVDTGLYGLAPHLRRLGVRIGVLMPPERLAKKALRAAFQGKRQVVPGGWTKFFRMVLPLVPRGVVKLLQRKILK